MTRSENEKDVGALILRLTVGGLMLFHGIAKLDGDLDWLQESLAEHGLPGFLGYGIYIGEVVAPVLLILGVAMRLSAAAIVTTMFFAVYLLHTDELFDLGKHGEYALEIQVFFAAGALAAALIGPGRFAVPLRGRWAQL